MIAYNKLVNNKWRYFTMKKVFVVGGSGRVATALIKDLVKQGNQVTAGARHPEKVVKLDNVTAVKLDLHDSQAAINQLINGYDAVYFTAGSRGHDVLQTDAMGAVKTMIAAETNHIQRYIMLSSMYALQSEKWAQIPALASIMDYNIAKFFADNYLISNTKLDYTIVQPATLTEETGTNMISVGENKDTDIPISDVANFLANCLTADNTIGKVLMIRKGETPINEAINAVK